MTTNQEPPQSELDRMLNWLADDRDQAAKKYESIRRRIIEILGSRGCPEAEHWADVTIDRVVSKIDKITKNYEGDPALYFYGVAKKVALECVKPKPNRNIPPPPPPDEDLELEHFCLEHCLKQLPSEDRDVVKEYYAKDGREKIDNRNKLAKKLGIGLNALRIRVHRIRIVLRKCVRECIKLEKDSASGGH
jgi:DNA-directed RNA polymerase specialized sigma24 family protein